MPRNKDLKRLARARMQKTGEDYTAARAQIVDRVRAPLARAEAHSPVDRPLTPEPADYARLAGFSDAVIKERTGCAWDKWVFALDRHGAAELSHGEITRLIKSKYKKVPGWWTQAVAVGYERIKGIRARGQRRDGTWEASKSRTFAVPVDALFSAWADGRTRKRWLDASGVKVRAATRPKSVRLTWPDGRIVSVWFTAKGANRSTVAVQHTRLPDRTTVEATKAYWAGRFDELAAVLIAKHLQTRQ
jgi:uncharacterized protein YndB with AHSA1/START domain